MKFFGKSDEDQKIEIIITNRTVVRVLLMVVLLILGLSALQLASSALLLIFVSFFLALALNAPVHWIAKNIPGKKRGSRGMATSISYLFVIGILIGFLSILIPPIFRQVSSLAETAPRIVRDLQDQNSAVGTFIRDNNLEGAVENLSNELSDLAKSSGSTALDTVGQVGASMVSTLAVLAMTFMMLVEGPRWVRLAKKLLPEEHRDHATKLSRDMYGVVKGFVNGQVALAAIASVMILPVMLILNVPYAGALAAIVFIAGLVPMIGHIIGSAIVTTVALFESPIAAVLIFSFYVLYQQIENYVVQPRVQSNTTNISPLLVLIAVLIGVNVNGIIGGLVAIPIMACLRILVLDYLQRSGRLEASSAPKIVAEA